MTVDNPFSTVPYPPPRDFGQLLLAIQLEAAAGWSYLFDFGPLLQAVQLEAAWQTGLDLASFPGQG